MKHLLFFASLALLGACTTQPQVESKTNNNFILAEDIQTILPMEMDTSMDWGCADFTNASTKLDQEKIFSFLKKGILAGKFKAYKDYPNKELSIADVDHILVTWDSTAQAEDPNHPGTFVSAPIKSEIPAETVAKLKFHETIEVDTVTNTFHSTVAYISVYILKKNEIGETMGTRKLFDVKLNEEKH